MNPDERLRDATVQDIQLELIRRSAFNTFDGERVCDLLYRHRDLWRTVLFDHPGVPNYTKPGSLLVGGLIKLRDLDQNLWNADTLYVLTASTAAAHKLAALFEESGTGAMPRVHDDREQIDMALGTMREENGLLTVWWD